MPLRDWSDDRGWDSVYQLWIVHLLFWFRQHLPAGYRAFLGSVPGLAVERAIGRPDPGVRQWRPEASAQATSAGPDSATEVAPDYRGVAVFTRDPQLAVHIARHGQLIAAIELVSPRNKDRPSSGEQYTRRYLGYLWEGVHLLLVDVHRRPLGFSFTDAVAAGLEYS